MGTDTDLAPTRADERIDTLDVLRGVAICGILLMNIPEMGGIGFTEGLIYPARWNAHWIAWGVQSVLFEGTMRGLFTMLFGAGMLLMLRKAEGAHPEVAPFDVWTRRCLALVFLGFVQWAVFFWPGEILFCYGVTGLFLLAFRTARPRTLLIAAGIALAGLSISSAQDSLSRYEKLSAVAPAQDAQRAGRHLTTAQTAALDDAKKMMERRHPSPAAIAKEKAQRTSLSSLFFWSRDFWSEFNLSLDGWMSVVESLCFMLIGMALFRTGILTGQARAGSYATLMAVGYGGGLALRLIGLALGARTGFDIDFHHLSLARSLYRGLDYEPARLLITLGHVGLIVGLFRSGLLGRAWPLRALGRMALTVYSLQSILTSILFYGFGYVGAFGFAGLMGSAAAIWIMTGLFCVTWLRRFSMGPAEWFLRGIAYASFSTRRRPVAGRILASSPAV